MFETLLEIYREVTGNDDVDVTPKTRLKDGLSLTSFGRVQLICAIEDYFDIEIPNRALLSFKTIGDIVDYLEKHV